MLIEFSVKNYRSFLEPQTLSMVANKASDLVEQNTFPAPVSGIERLLRSTVIYGPNAAGKSNFIRAVDEMKCFILSSAKESQAGEEIPVTPFLFERQNPDAPSEFEILFVQDGVRYQYGFAANTSRVIHEWLIAYPESRGQRWFEREYDASQERYKWYFGPKFTGHKKVWQDATRSNALFLSTAVQLNCEQLTPVLTWFKNLAVIKQGAFLFPDFTIKQCKDDEKKKRILKLLQVADPSIENLIFKKEDFSFERIPAELPEAIKVELEKDLTGTKLTRVYCLHKASGLGEAIPVDITEESGGTRKLFAYAGPWLDILKNGCVVVVDEFNNSFHPLMVRYLINLINNSSTNAKNAQLIFTTHETTLLDKNIMRRDQVWFVEKDEKNATDLYPLTDFSPRKGEALESGYLHGRYGALPYIGSLDF